MHLKDANLFQHADLLYMETFFISVFQLGLYLRGCGHDRRRPYVKLLHASHAVQNSRIDVES